MPRKLTENFGAVYDLGKGQRHVRLLTALGAAIAIVGLFFSGCMDPARTNATTETASNTEPIKDFGKLQLTDAKGDSKSVTEWAGGKHLVMIVSRGYFGTLCPYCSAQAHDLAMGYDEIKAEGATLVLVFPVENKVDGVKWEEFQSDALKDTGLEKEGFPFPVVVDEGLAVVDRLGIRGQLAKPATYILDSAGNLRFSYVGRDPGDRPRFGTILEQLKQLD
jgi:peroxiredoxin